MKQSDRKNRKNQMRNQFKQIGQGLFVAGISGAMTVGLLLTACAGQPGGQTTVTQDDLTQLSTVQDVLERDVGNGKNYAYHWGAEDIEATMAQLNEQIQTLRAQREEWLKDAENMTPEELAEAGFESIGQAREALEQLQKYEQEMLESEREALEEQAALDPVVSPQEAANRAGVLFEQMFGVDLSQEVLKLNCRESGGDTILHPDRMGALRPVWAVSRDEAADGVLFSTSSFYCTLDATTGEIIAVNYDPTAQDFEQLRALPYPACFVELGDGGNGFGRWNTEDPSFGPMVEQVVQSLRQSLSGSPLTGGAQVADIQWEVKEFAKESEDGRNEVWFRVSCDDGKSYSLQAAMPYDLFYGEATGYPMRGFRMWNDTYQ